MNTKKQLLVEALTVIVCFAIYFVLLHFGHTMLDAFIKTVEFMLACCVLCHILAQHENNFFLHTELSLFTNCFYILAFLLSQIPVLWMDCVVITVCVYVHYEFVCDLSFTPIRSRPPENGYYEEYEEYVEKIFDYQKVFPWFFVQGALVFFLLKAFVSLPAL